MKKILSLIIAIVLIFSCFAITVFAEDVDIFSAKEPKATFSEDYKKLYVDGEPFSRIDSSMLISDIDYMLLVDDVYNQEYDTGNDIYVELTEAQKEEVNLIEFECNGQRNIYRVSITYKDGSQFISTFLKDKYLEEYNQLLNGEASEYEIEFLFPEGNIVKAEKNQLFGEAVTLKRKELEDFNDLFDVTVRNADGSIVLGVGLMIRIGDDYYYADYEELGIKMHIGWDGMSGIAGKTIYHITDEALLIDIKAAQESYFEDDFGILYDEDATDGISKVFFTVIFLVIPLALLVIFLIKAIRGKGIYRKMYITIAVLCAVIIVVFTILASFISTFADSSESFIGGSDYADDIQISTDLFGEFNDDTTTLEILELKISGADAVMVKRAEYCGDNNCSNGCVEGVFCIRKDCAVDDAMLQLGIGKPNGYDEYYNEETMETSVITDMIEYENGYEVEYEIIGVG